MYRYGLIGNCQVSALVSQNASIDWLCLPRPDSDPVFGRILDPNGGHFSISFASGEPSLTRQYYVENTNILVTEVENKAGDRYRVTDFCPRFGQFGRVYRPISIFRLVEPLEGTPTLTVQCNPVKGWTKTTAPTIRGNSHLCWEIRGDHLRLTTNMPLTHLSEQSAFHMREKIYFALTWSSGLEDDVTQVSENFLMLTRRYWQAWVKHCNIPSQFQKEVIRSALVLKLHCYEDTGAILAALTTSLPEEPGNQRNWDYRFCWLRDSYFVLSAFHALGHFEEMEGFLKFLLGIAKRRDASDARLAPVYRLCGSLPLPERLHLEWAGFDRSVPVRSNNQAAEHIQNDVYGEMALMLAPIFFDERFYDLRTREHEELMENLGMLCATTISRADAGIWELRNHWQEHTYSNLMCWAGLERIERIRKSGFLKNLAFNVITERQRAEDAVRRAIVDGVLRNGPHDNSLDAALALSVMVRFPMNDVGLKTIDRIRKDLSADGGKGSYIYRYSRSDDFGKPYSAFIICSFWMAQALARHGRREEACQILTDLQSAANSLGLLSEHLLPQQGLQLGNFPQAYSHVGLINASFEASPPWSEVL